MNCKQGDIAVIVRSMAENHGRVVTCIKMLGPGPHIIGTDFLLGEEGNWWLIDTKINTMRGGVLHHNTMPYVMDSQLMPIGNTGVKVKEAENVHD